MTVAEAKELTDEYAVLQTRRASVQALIAGEGASALLSVGTTNSTNERDATWIRATMSDETVRAAIWASVHDELDAIEARMTEIEDTFNP